MYLIRYGTTHWFCRYSQLDGAVAVANRRYAKEFPNDQHAWARKYAEVTGGTLIYKEGTEVREVQESGLEQKLRVYELRSLCSDIDSEFHAFAAFLSQGENFGQKLDSWLKKQQVTNGYRVVWLEGIDYSKVKAMCKAMSTVGIYATVTQRNQLGGGTICGVAFDATDFNTNVVYID